VTTAEIVTIITHMLREARRRNSLSFLEVLSSSEECISSYEVLVACPTNDCVRGFVTVEDEALDVFAGFKEIKPAC